MKFDVETIFFGVAVTLNDKRNHTYANAKIMKCKIWYEDGFFYIDDETDNVICVVAANVRQFMKKKNDESKREEVTPRVSKKSLVETR
jgi:hypothetical protein